MRDYNIIVWYIAMDIANTRKLGRYKLTTNNSAPSAPSRLASICNHRGRVRYIDGGTKRD